MSAIEAGRRYVQGGIAMYLDYRPDDRGDPTIEAWCFVMNEDDPTGEFGHLEVTIHEIVETERSGTLAVYYRQWFNPEGEPFGRRQRKVASIGSLKALIRRRNMSTPLADGERDGG